MDQQQPEVVIKAVDSGPYQVKGPVRLVDHDGKAFDVPSRRSVLLCRCGNSATKPLCDGAHTPTGFQADDRA
jgi:CDGSH-type Zn-finger protein